MNSNIETIKPKKKKKFMRLETRFTIVGLIFALPSIIYLVGLNLVPIIQSAYYSLCNYTIFRAPEFIWFQNYIDLFKDDKFHKAFFNTVYMVVATPINLAVALFLASLLNAKVKALPVFRTIFYLPTVVPIIAMSILWKWILNGEYGILNYALGLIGIPGPGWLTDPNWTKPALIIMSCWSVGTSIIIYLAALQGVPKSLYEAADLDGAHMFQKLWNITLPTISPITLFLLITGILDRFQIFAQSYVFTRVGQLAQEAGPGNSLLFFAVNIYNLAFRDLKMGYASAWAWILFIMSALTSFAIFKASKKLVSYDGGGN